ISLISPPISTLRTSFPGKVIVLAGDTRQLPPVVPNGGEAETTAASVLSSAYYRNDVEIFHLSKTMRNKDDPGFSEMVDDICDGVSDIDEAGLTTITGVPTKLWMWPSISFFLMTSSKIPLPSAASFPPTMIPSLV
ncbi:unnamed protein product, partial [Ectocarpus sp. 4 AP-2014]